MIYPIPIVISKAEATKMSYIHKFEDAAAQLLSIERRHVFRRHGIVGSIGDIRFRSVKAAPPDINASQVLGRRFR